MKSPSGKLLGKMAGQFVAVGSELPHDHLVQVNNSGMVPRVLRANSEQLTAMRRAHDGKPEPRQRKPGLIVPEKKIVAATAVNFKPDELPDCKIGAAFLFRARMCEPLEETLAKRDDPTRIGSVSSNLFTEANYPTARHGDVNVIARAATFGKSMSNDALAAWPKRVLEATKKVVEFAPAKGEAQVLQAAPRPAFEGCYPLVAYGNFWAFPGGDRPFLRASLVGELRCVGGVWRSPQGDWRGSWWFLVFEYLLDLAA